MRQPSFRSRLFTINKAIVSNQKVKSVWREHRIRLRPKPAPAEAVCSSAKAAGEKPPDTVKLPIFMSIVIVTGAAGLIRLKSVKPV
jgi:hypothetical protein